MKTAVKMFFIFSMAFSISSASGSEAIEGIWESDDGESKIQISKCGSNFCSTIVWLKTARKDAENENKALRDRDLVGTQISNDLTPAGNNRWSGNVYAPKKGKTYSGFATVKGDRLTMRGCLTRAGILCIGRQFNRNQ